MKIVKVKQTYPGEGDVTLHLSQSDLIRLQVALERYSQIIDVNMIPSIPRWAALIADIRGRLSIKMARYE